MPSVIRTPDYGRRLIPVIIDEEAKTNPDHVVYSFPLTDDPSKGFREVTNRDYANAINRAAWWMQSTLGRSETFESVGYLGPSDIRYMILAVAAVKCGYKIVFLSPRNSLDGHLNVMEKSQCDIWLLPSPSPAGVDRILAKRPMRLAFLPSLSSFLEESLVEVYPYNKTFEEARSEPFAVLHTSGSTGLPKPIVVRHGWFCTLDAQHLLPSVDGRRPAAEFMSYPHRAYSTFPCFHAAGLLYNFAQPCFYGLSIVFGPTSAPVNLDLIDSMLNHAEIDGLMLAPSSIESIANSPMSMDKVKKHAFVVAGGGAVAVEAGNRINSVTKLLNMFGTTECSSFPTMETHREVWNYLNYHPAAGFEFRETFDGLYEQFQVRNKKYDSFQGIFQTFPELDEFPTRDLYSKHPTMPDYWLYRGRADHIIVLSNGEKLNPLDMEATINDHPAVKTSLIVGQGRFQTLALIELNRSLPSDAEELKKFQDSIWETVKIANIQAPAHAQLYKDYIMFGSPDRPFPLAGKGTVLRNETLKLYHDDIDNFYEQADKEISADDVDFDGSSLESVTASIGKFLPETLKNQMIGPQDDFFAAGLDSLSVFTLVRTLRAVIQPQDSISASTIYGNPTVEKLSRAVHRILHPDAVNGTNIAEETLQEMRQMIGKYTTDLPMRKSLPQEPIVDNETSVILTGSTGSLGSYLLDKLVSMPHIKRIFCLNRALDGRAKQTEASGARGLETSWPSDRVQFYKADLSKPDFGLDKDTFEEVQKSTTHIIHNQWQVDFNLSLSSFEPHIRGVRNLVDFSIESKHNARIFFISSVAVGMKGGTSTISETPIVNLLAGEGGYGQSKLVSEWILEVAKNQSSVPTSVCRVGQIAGPIEVDAGMWNKQEWLPTIISTSRYLGLIPSSLSSMSNIDWLPVNTLSTILAELASLSSPDAPKTLSEQMPIFHTVNPSTVPWSALLPTITSHLGPTVKVTGWKDWLAALEKSASDGDDVEKNPGIKLLDFYRGIEETGDEAPTYLTENTVKYSQTLNDLGPVKSEWVSDWLSQWGFLNMAVYGR